MIFTWNKWRKNRKKNPHNPKNIPFHLLTQTIHLQSIVHKKPCNFCTHHSSHPSPNVPPFHSHQDTWSSYLDQYCMSEWAAWSHAVPLHRYAWPWWEADFHHDQWRRSRQCDIGRASRLRQVAHKRGVGGLEPGSRIASALVWLDRWAWWGVAIRIVGMRRCVTVRLLKMQVGGVGVRKQTSRT